MLAPEGKPFFIKLWHSGTSPISLKTSLLLATVTVPIVVLIARAIIHSKSEPLKPEVIPNPLKTAFESNPSPIRLLKEDVGREKLVSVGQPFSIELWHSYSTGYDQWEVVGVPFFINKLGHYADRQQGSEIIEEGKQLCVCF